MYVHKMYITTMCFDLKYLSVYTNKHLVYMHFIFSTDLLIRICDQPHEKGMQGQTFQN